MKLIDERPYKSFKYDGKEFMLRLYVTESGYRLAGYLQNKQVTPTYGLDFSKDDEHLKQVGVSLVENLFEHVQGDIDHGLCSI